jgi:hypothetical protein
MSTACQLTCPSSLSSSSSSLYNLNDTTSILDAAFCYGTGVSMIMEGFVSQLVEGPGKAPCINYLFPKWTLDTRGKFAAACLGTLVMGLLIGFLGSVRSKYIAKSTLLCPCAKICLSTFILAVNFTLGYFEMLIAMTYNAELFVMVVLGLTAGYVIFNTDFHNMGSSGTTNSGGTHHYKKSDEIPCCSPPLEDDGSTQDNEAPERR